MFGDILQPTHLLFILAVALLVLGPKRLPEVGRQLGKGLRDFRGAMAGITEESHGLFEEATVPLNQPTEQPAAMTVAPTIDADDAEGVEPIPEEHREAAAAHAEHVASAAQSVASSSPASAAPAPSTVPLPPA